MALQLSDLYNASSTDKVLDLEKGLKHDLEELKQELSVFETPSKALSSIPMPKDVSHYREERRIIVDRAMEVSHAQPLIIQAEVMKEEMFNAECLEYTLDSLPLMLHQHFVDRIQHIIQCKYRHLQRWKRFSHSTAAIETLYPLYQKRLSHILSEYNDCVARARRLALARESYLCKTDDVLEVIELQDLLIYLRWLVCHLHSTKKVNQFLRLLQWIHILCKAELAPLIKEDLEQPQEETKSMVTTLTSSYQIDNSSSLAAAKSAVSRYPSAIPPASIMTTVASSYQNDISTSLTIVKSAVSQNLSTVPSTSQTTVPFPPAINPILLSTTALPSTSLVYAAAACSGGINIDKEGVRLPLNAIDFSSLKPHLAFLLNVYGINFDLDGVKNSADEMEMYAAVNRNFKPIFQKQEAMKTFKTYDRMELSHENWEKDSPTHALKQESNWLQYIRLKPEKNANQEKICTQLRQTNNVEELLRIQAHFIHVTVSEQVQKILKEHASLIHNCTSAKPVPGNINYDAHNVNTLQVWRNIYCNPEIFNPKKDEDPVEDDFDERDIERVNLNTRHSGNARKGQDGQNYINTVQMLGLDEGEQDENDPASVHGAYLAFLHLRHLRLRDLQRSCLSVLNYFRSLERTLTINDAGLTQDDTNFKQVCSQNHRTAMETDGTVGGGGGLASHAYLHDTSADFKLSETEFVEFADISNHDDFYTIDDGRIHVQDQRGYYIMYEAAIKDLEELEKDLMLLSTHYIEKDRSLRGLSKVNKVRQRQPSLAGSRQFDSLNSAYTEVDRFGVMLDLWSNEMAFMECKHELVNCYMEAYHNVFDRDEKRALAQVIVNLIHQRPRFDLSDSYFIKIYRAECVILKQHAQLIKAVLNEQIDEQREYNKKVCRNGDLYGLPHQILPKQPLAVNNTKPALTKLFILEFHPTLAIASKVHKALKFALQELLHIHTPDSVLESLIMEKKLYEVALREWNTMENIGTLFSPQMQKDLFSEVITEDPLFLSEIAERFVAEEHEEEIHGQVKEQKKLMLTRVGRVMDMVHARHRLIDAAWETELLTKIYKMQAQDLGYDEFHLYIRFVQLEFASFKEDAGKPPPIFITSVLEDESLVDRYTPGFLYMAIHELDEAHVGRFSFRSQEGILELLKPGGLEVLQVVLKSQIVHKNALTCAVQQVHICQEVTDTNYSKSDSPNEIKSEKSINTQLNTQLTGITISPVNTALTAKTPEPGRVKKKFQEAFMSLQIEKTPSRDIMLNEFITKKNQMGSVYRNAEEMTKLKRSIISQYCVNFNRRLAQFSLRGQLLSYYNSMLSLLADFPQVRDTYFMLGQPNEKKSNLDEISGLQPEPRKTRKRPRHVLSPDGNKVLNIWFIPHYTETLVMFKSLDDEQCVAALTYCLLIVSALHDMLQYLCAHSRLGSSHARLGSQKMEFTSADWGGTEGIGAELREIQKQIDNLVLSTDPRSVSEFMVLRRDVMFLEFDTAVRHCMISTFLSTGNTQAYKSIISNFYHALPALSNVQTPSLFATYLSIPEPLESRDISAKELFPIRTFYGRNGPYPTMFYQLYMIEYYIQLCLAGLKDVDRHVANGEILGVTLLMEDVLQTGFQDVSLLKENANGEPDEKPRSNSLKVAEVRKSSSSHGNSSKLSQNVSLSRTQEPIKAYKLLKFFLSLWKCLEYLKCDWGKRRLGVQNIQSMSLYKDFCKAYKTEIYLPVLQSVARRLGQGEMYDGIGLDTDPLVMPRGASEIEVRAKQLVKLFENLECHMINELRKKLSKELTLVLAERGRIEETALCTDLWKRPVMKESFTISKPQMTEAFCEKIMSQSEITDDTITVSRKQLNMSIAELTTAITAREKSNFENYTMFYENLLRSVHQNLYQKEQEVKHLHHQLKTIQQNAEVDMQDQLATQGRDLVIEITALRAKVSEMHEMSAKMQMEVQERVREEYDDLIKNLFSSTFSLKNKFDEFRTEMHDDVFEKVAETRREAFETMNKVRQKFGTSQDDIVGDRMLAKSKKFQELKQEHDILNTLIAKMRAMKTWRHVHDNVIFTKSIQGLKNESESNKKVCESMRMEAEEQINVLGQQITSLQKALTDAQKEANEVKKQLDKELKEKLEKTHETMQKARNQKQLELAKQANIEKLLEELQDKEAQLQLLAEEKDRNLKQHSTFYDKIKKDIETTRKQLTHERNMKLDAFQRFEDLQAVVYDYESCVSRTHSVVIATSPSTGKRTRVQSAHTKSLGTPSSGLFPPAVIWPNNRTLTPEMGGLNNEPPKKMQRPKTVGGRLRSRVAEQLLNELELDSRQTIVQLEELSMDGGRSNINY